MDHPEPDSCVTCGRAFETNGRFCPHCGSERPGAPAVEEDAPQEGKARKAGALTWETDVSLLTNPTMLQQFGFLLGGSALIMALLLSFVMAVQGEWERILSALWITAIAVGFVGLLMLLVILLVFRNRFRARFSVTEKGVRFETVDRRAKTGNRLATLAGAVGGDPTVAGAGLVGMSRETEFVSWRGIARAVYYPRKHTITLRNSWRTVSFLACTPDNYCHVAAFVEQRLAANVATRATPVPSPLPRLLGRSALAVLACLPVFLLPYPFELDIFLPLLMLCFALATVWLIPFFGWVVIACAAWIGVEIILIGFEVRESFFASVGSYRPFERLDGEETLALMLAAAGLAYLVVTSWRAARGLVGSALSGDVDGMEG